jgi:hypothetical protein
VRYDFAFLWGLLLVSEVQNIDRNSPQGMPSGERFSSLGAAEIGSTSDLGLGVWFKGLILGRGSGQKRKISYPVA